MNYTLPINIPTSKREQEKILSQAFQAVFEQELQQSMQDLVDYGCPHIGSPTVVERFTKQDGLVVLRRPMVSDKIMRIIYANWISMPSERGLNFIEFVLNMLWENNWSIARVWHSIAKAESYPQFLIESNSAIAGHFLTSRIHLKLNSSIDLKEIIELSPVVKRMVPANIVMKIVAEGLNEESESFKFGIAVRAKTIQFVDLS